MKKSLIRFALLNSLACFAVMATGCESSDSTKPSPQAKTELGGSAPLEEAGSTTVDAGVDVPEAEPDMKKSEPKLDTDGNPVTPKSETPEPEKPKAEPKPESRPKRNPRLNQSLKRLQRRNRKQLVNQL